LVDLRRSSFIGNHASEGAALIALQEMNLAYSASSFKQNTAVYGGDVASTPTSLRLRIYDFESYFLFINNTSVQDILSSPTTVKIFLFVNSIFSRQLSMIQLLLVFLNQLRLYLEPIQIFYLRSLFWMLLEKKWVKLTMRMLFKFSSRLALNIFLGKESLKSQVHLLLQILLEY